jgi:acetoin utilization deacetylase AcuC-like enzyme
MARHHGPVLVDTNVILESHRIRAWASLAGGYRVETVEDCVTETQTGFQRRRPEQQIDAKALVAPNQRP